MAEERATAKGKGKGKRLAIELGNDYKVREALLSRSTLNGYLN